MGEQEQSGMLRVVVILGLIAIIAGVSISGILTLKGKMAENTGNTTNRIEQAAKNLPEGQVLATDDLSTANAKAENLIRMTQDNVDVSQGYVDGPSSTKTGHWVGYGQPLSYDTNQVVSNTNNGFAIFSPLVTIPKAATKVTFSANVWSDGGYRQVCLQGYDSAQNTLNYSLGDHQVYPGWKQLTYTWDLSNGTFQGADQVRMFISHDNGVIKVKNASITFS